MSEPEDDPEKDLNMFGITSEARAALAANLIALVDLVSPFAESHLRSAMRAEFKGLSMAAENVDSIVEGLCNELAQEGASAEDIESAASECRERLEKVIAEAEKEHSEEIDELVQMAIDECVPVLVGAWVNALNEFVSRQGGVAWLRLSLLGDDMLPMGDKDSEIAFVANLQECPLDSTVAREILKTVRTSLPVGKKLPDQAVSVLELAWNVVILP